MKFYEFIEDVCVFHWLVAEDDAQARGVMVGMALETSPIESSESKWTMREVPEDDLDVVTWLDENGPDGCRRRPALDMMREQAAIGPGYVACSEF